MNDVSDSTGLYTRGEVPFWPGVRGQRMRVTGGEIHYVTIGEKTSPPVVLIHKLGGWVADWRHVAELLAVDYFVVVVDAPGHGGSILDKEITWAHPITESSAALREFLSNLDLGSVHLMGSSLGGVLSIQLSSDEPALVRTLGLVGVSMTERHSLERTLENDRNVRSMFTEDWSPLPFPIAEDLDQNAHSRATEQNASRMQAGRWSRASERGFGLTGIEQRLEFVEAPVFLLNGVNAAYRKYEQVAREKLRDVRIETADVEGMFPHQEAPEFTATRWRAFVADVADRGEA